MVAWWQIFKNLQGTAIHTYANKIVVHTVVHTVTIHSPLVVALPIQSPMLMPVTYERCSYVLSFGGRCPYLDINSFASSIQEMFLCSVLSLAHQQKVFMELSFMKYSIMEFSFMKFSIHAIFIPEIFSRAIFNIGIFL